MKQILQHPPSPANSNGTKKDTTSSCLPSTYGELLCGNFRRKFSLHSLSGSGVGSERRSLQRIVEMDYEWCLFLGFEGSGLRVIGRQLLDVKSRGLKRRFGLEKKARSE